MMPTSAINRLAAAALLISLAIRLAGSRGIDRHVVVSRYNPTRNASSTTTPLQVGNGNFAFGADVSGLQTFQPFNTLSSWGWKNDSFPPNRTLEDVLAYRGVSWWNHDKLVQYEFGGVDDLQQWLISNPNRANLGRIGLLFRDTAGQVQDVTEADLNGTRQTLDLWTGKINSTFQWSGAEVRVETTSHQRSDVVGITLSSELLNGTASQLGIFLDFPWNDGKAKFSAPFVGVYNATSNHTTTLVDLSQSQGNVRAQIVHDTDGAVFLTSVAGDGFTITRDSPNAHRYSIIPSGRSVGFSMSISYSLASTDQTSIPPPSDIEESSTSTWSKYWSTGSFVDVVTGSQDTRADELQRRIILSRYLMRVNEAGDAPPQESGLTNNGWYGKFHLEQYWWHNWHWALWGDWDLLHRSLPFYDRFLPTSIERAQKQQPWGAGARWGKMSDPSGRSAPGEINELLIWQQPHPLVFAEYERRALPGEREVLTKWRNVVKETADWMAAFAWYNTSTGVYDLGPPMYPVSEDTSPNVTTNTAFELAYWPLGFSIAMNWMRELGEDVPEAWTTVAQGLAPLPETNGTYDVYEGIPSDFWDTPEYTSDHPALVGVLGWLPPTPGLNETTAKATAEKVWTNWNISNLYSWDCPLLALSAARIGEPEKAVEWLLHPLFAFDDAGMPQGGGRVPTPYFPGSGSFLAAIAMMAKGWDGSVGDAPGFPKSGWDVKSEGLSKAL